MKAHKVLFALALVCSCAQVLRANTMVWSIAIAGNWIDSFWISEENDLQFPWLWPIGPGTNIRRVFPAVGVLDTVVTIDVSTFAAVTDDLYVNDNGSGATVSVDLQVGGILVTNHTSVGYPASGEFNQSGGIHQTGQLWIGSGEGIYRLSGTGELVSPIVEIGGGCPGCNGGGTGVFFQTGGTHTVSTRLRLGQLPFSTAVYEMHHGSLDVQTEVIAGSGRAGFYQVGGTHTIAGSLTLGEAGPSLGAPPTEGIYVLGAGTLTVPTIQVLRGTFDQAGGTHSVSGILTLGALGSLDASYTLSGGTLSVGGINNGTVQGNDLNGISYFNFDGGALLLSGNIIALDTFNIGHALGSNGGYTLASGVTLTAENEAIGVEGTGVLVQNGGTHTVTFDLTLGELLGGHGDYTLNGGVFSANAIKNGNGTGTFTQTGGVNTVTSLSVAPNGSSYALQAGQLNAESITANNATAFNFTGGTLVVEEFNGDLFNNGGTLSPGDSPGTTHVFGNYDQSASGSLTIELGGLTSGTYDVVAVDGTASIAGRLDVVLLNGFTPVVGSQFDILRTTALEGKFHMTNLPALNPNLRWLVSYAPWVLNPAGAYSVSLTVVPAASADFDRDGDVDLHDLVLFEKCSSEPAMAFDLKCAPGVQDMDFDDDSDIDLSDFSAFQRCYSGDGVAGDPTCGE